MTTTLTIRPTRASDLAAVDALLARSYPALLKADYPPSLLVTAVPHIARAKPHLLRCGTYFAVEDADGAIVGAGGWTPAAPGRGTPVQGTTASVRHVVCDHTRTRQGIGRALMTHICATAHAAGVRRLECQSTLTAVPFYTACGFATLGPAMVPLVAGLDFPIMLMRRSV